MREVLFSKQKQKKWREGGTNSFSTGVKILLDCEARSASDLAPQITPV